MRCGFERRGDDSFQVRRDAGFEVRITSGIHVNTQSANFTGATMGRRTTANERFRHSFLIPPLADCTAVAPNHLQRRSSASTEGRQLERRIKFQRGIEDSGS